jgi:hypothetical protein
MGRLAPGWPKALGKARRAAHAGRLFAESREPSHSVDRPYASVPCGVIPIRGE